MKWTSSSRLDRVVDGYTHALFAKHPRSRYLIGLDAYVYALLGMCPEWLFDAVFLVTNSIPIPACIQNQSRGDNPVWVQNQ